MQRKRDSLKTLFSKGKFPSEKHFADLIDSSVNRLEDGIAKEPRDGLQLAPHGDHDQLLSFYERMDHPLPAWQVKLLRNNGARGLGFSRVTRGRNGDTESSTALFLANDHHVGLHTDRPRLPVEVAGTLGATARVGTLHTGRVPADGQWHDITDPYDDVQALEVVARADGPKGRGKYAVTHGIALNAFGGKGSRPAIRQTRTYFGWFFNRIDLRWSGGYKQYRLQVRTFTHYGLDEGNRTSDIRFHITGLWDDGLFADHD
ncbi:hypothetical protein CLV84_1031 [Neolewinella xylanilytica]|uniref:Uncharacterized protein n=1 Tax=Neolewinella xylanilytica TaxID=1514080 RepID=A0A2S6I9A9_9BACT|nr:hypothetical protein [Neolewinella xylanilytica]PPK88068.1 hypothetical protein CLV84_1031 [Neolewinella xylanilytica]